MKWKAPNIIEFILLISFVILIYFSAIQKSDIKEETHMPNTQENTTGI